MTARISPRPGIRRRITRGVGGAITGAAVALTVGLSAVALAPDNGFADLAAAAATRLMLVPLGLVFGAFLALRRPR